MSDALGLHTPKFRTLSRLTDWVRRRCIRTRLPADREQVFFKVAETNPRDVASHLVKYAEWVGPLGTDLENLLRSEPECVMAYGEVLARWIPNEPGDRHRLPEHLHSCLAGNYGLLARLSRHIGKRISPELEKTIFDDCTDAKMRASRAVSYAENVGKLDEDMEQMICGENGMVLKYASILKRHGQILPERMMFSLKGDSNNLYTLARNHLCGRLPAELEESIDEPGCLYEYARNVVKGRLPESLELVFLKDWRFAIRYAFDVVRAYASVQLPDELHTMLVMKSYENPNDNEIKHYIRETNKTP